MRWIALLLVATALAGCSESAEPVEDDSTFDDIEVKATDSTGIIRGIVVDPTITPIADAKIVLVNSGKETTTNAAGAFGFDGLEPGTYFLTADKLGFTGVQQAAEVVAGEPEPPIVKFLLDPDPSQLPFFVIDEWAGHVACGLSVANFCAAPVVNGLAGDDFSTRIEVDRPNMTYLQSEMVWETTVSASPNMQLWQEAPAKESGGGCWFDAVNAPSPLVMNVTFGDYDRQGSRECFESLGDTRDISYRVFPGSIDGTHPPTEDQCYPLVITKLCTGVGFTIDQPFTVYTHMFYGYKPPEGWQFSAESYTPPPPQ